VIDVRYLLKKTFKDKRGRIVIVQYPNLPLIGWFLFESVSLLLPKGNTKLAIQDIATAILFSWAYLEITKGVNYFRRLFGVVVMVIILTGYFVVR
jgi:hypothetical protein